MNDDFDWQGKRRDQVESSYKIIGYTVLSFLCLGLIYFLFKL